MRTTGIAVALGLAVMGSGCALIDQQVELRYSPLIAEAEGEAGEPGAVPAVSEQIDRGQVFVVDPASPELEAKDQDKKIIGTVKNTYGMKTADAVTTASVSDWVASALSAELERLGYQAERVGEAPAAGRTVETRIIRIWVDQDPGFWTVGAVADLNLRITVEEDGQRVKEFDVQARGQGDRGLFGDSDTKAKALEKALQECLREAIPHITEAFGRQS